MSSRPDIERKEENAIHGLVLLSQQAPYPSAVFFYSKSARDDIVLADDSDWRKKLSAFCPSVITIDGKTFPSVENAFHYYKWWYTENHAHLADDRYLVGGLFHEQPQKAKSSTSRTAMKKVGAILKVGEWNTARVAVMRRLLQARFNQDDHFRKILFEAEQRNFCLLHFERGNNSFWGCKRSKETEEIVGENMYGKLLMHHFLNNNHTIHCTSNLQMS